MDFKTVTNVFLKMGSPDRWNDYRKKSYTHELLDEANRLAANTGARIGWAVECSQESYGDFWTTTQAVYHDLDVAIAHVYGAIQYESARDVADDDIDYDGDPSWSLRDVMMRNTLPEHLAAYASGEKTAPHRPLILDEKGIYSLEVPERGRVIYSGCGAEAAAVAALCTLPNSKVSSTTRLKSQECRCIVDLTIQGFELNWKCQYDWGSLIPGHAIAEGMDKTNLVKQAFDAIQNAKEKSREQENQE